MKNKTVTINVGDTSRLDKCLVSHLPEFSRSRIQQLIAGGCVSVGGATITDAAHKVKQGETYNIVVPEAEPMEVRANPIKLDIIFEDKHLLVIDKPAGMTVHPAPGHTHDTLVNALLAHCGDSLSGIGGVMRPGIVHRIDKDTSGLLVVAKHDQAHRHLAGQLADRSLTREYLAVVRGVPKPPFGSISAAIARSNINRKKMAVVKSGGRDALTHYKAEEIFDSAALLRCKLTTGRTHQIRVHLTHIGHPLIGDPVYGRSHKLVINGSPIEFERQALHAEHITFIHPKTGKKMDFTSEIPQDIEELLNALRGS